MQKDSPQERVETIIDQLIGPRIRNALSLDYYDTTPRLDLSKPNIHESKKDFVKERDAVASIVEHLRAALRELHGDRDDIKQKEMITRLVYAVDAGARTPQDYDDLESSQDLALRNIVQTGFFFNSQLVVIRMIDVYEKRLKELQDQEKQFWSLSYRAPNYYARLIALRLARLYANTKRKKPTFGTVRDGNHPSTDFGRALEEIFRILGIRAAVRNAADWAIDQLTEDEINPSQNALASLVGTFPSSSRPYGRDKQQNAMNDEIAVLLSRKT